MNKWLSIAYLIGSLCLAGEALCQYVPELKTFVDLDQYVQQRSVKIYGAGGLKQMEAYQSGVCISPAGHVVTMASTVLDRNTVTVIMSDGQRQQGTVVGVDPLLDIAVLKLDTTDAALPCYDFQSPATPEEGMGVFAFSNLYNIATGDEPVSVQRGVLTAVAPLNARRGAFATRYRGDVYIVDIATSNPGAAGGIVVDGHGIPLGLVGKEVRSQLTGAYLNYALPWEAVGEGVQRILNGETVPNTAADDMPENPATLQALGFRVVPSVVPRTPPFVDEVLLNSPAQVAGLELNDLIISVADMRIGSSTDVDQALQHQPMDQPVRITVLRGGTLRDLELLPRPEPAP